MLELCAARVDCQRLMQRWCAKNILFFINAFVWTLDTRKTKSGTISPFITFRYQDEAILKIQKSIFPPPGGVQHGIVIEKSRDMGATWLCTLVFLHALLFQPQVVQLFCMSYKEEVVDGEYDSMMGKARLVMENLPSWLMPKMKLTYLLFKNLETGSSWKGSSTTQDAGVSGRYTSMFLDEFSLVPDAHVLWPRTAACADSRIVNGTHRGTGIQFAEIVKQAEIVPLSKVVADRSVIQKVQCHWSVHPWKAKGMYRDENGKLWSPWYTQECTRLGWNKQQIAQELDMNAQGAGWQFFDPEEIGRLVKQYATDPLREGIMHGSTFLPRKGGHLKVWFQGSPPRGIYGIGCDVAAGTGGKKSTPSCLSVANLETGEKLAELSDGDLRPDQFAKLVRDIAAWFHGAKINWENLGPVGATFRRVLLQELGYTNIYLRRSERKVNSEITMEPGWYPTPEAKGDLLGDYRSALSSGLFLNRSKYALEETLQFVFKDGKVEHSLESVKNAPGSVKAFHGDQVIADALAWLLVREHGVVKEKAEQGGGVEEKGPPPYGSPAWRDMMDQPDEWDGW